MKLIDNFINGKADKKETEFLPAILEVTETPPSPVGRMVLWSILLLLVIVLLWSLIGSINEVAVANGKVIPMGQVKTVQVKNKGVIKEIFVKEGQYVHEGETLMILDPTSTDADVDSLAKRAAYYRLDIQRLEAELTGKAFIPSTAADPGDPIDNWDKYLSTEDIAAEKALHQSRVSQHSAEMLSAQKTVEQKRAQLSGQRDILEKYDKMLAIAAEKEHRLQLLLEQDAISQFQLMEQTSQRINLEESAEAQYDAINSAEAELAEAYSRLTNVDATYKRDTMNALVESRKQYYSYVEELKKANENQRLATIVAPCSGRICNLSVHTDGGVVTEAQPLLMVVPDGVDMELEVWADNKDIGFIKEGQDAEVKITTFNFQKFGMVKATVDAISPDALDDKSDPEKYKKYRLLLKLAEKTINISGENIQLSPGMDVTAEIKTREKRIIEFFLDPFRRYTQEALRER